MKTVLPIVLLAIVLTGLNALKPLHVDDTTYCFNAHQIAAHPFDPYGYNILYFSDPLPALHVLAPPVQPAWWALGIRLFGERPVLWKVWMFPFALIFVASLASLLRRFAPSSATSLLILLTLSPVILPSLNLMIDLPALALSLAALALFFRACDRESLGLALAAGLIAGLGMETKYTGFLAPAVLLTFSVLHRRFRLGLLSATTAALVFSAWELFLVWRYGESHFRYHTSQTPFHPLEKLGLVACLFPILGAVVPTLCLLALTLLRIPRRSLLVAALFALLPYLLIFWFDPVVVDFGYDYLPLTGVLFSANGAIMLAGVTWAGWRLVHPLREQPMLRPFLPQGRVAWFLVLWVGLELAGYVILSPFPAVRRIMGLTVAATFLLGHLAEQVPLEPWRRQVLLGLVVATALLGFGYCGVDYVEARAERQAAYDAAQRIRQREPNAVIWYAGYWGFQYYAEEVGMKQAVPQTDDAPAAQLLPPTHFQRGDWLVIPSTDFPAAIPQQQIDLDCPELELKERIYLDDAVPLRTLIFYYAGAPPLRHRKEPRFDVRLFRVKSDFICR